MMREQRQGRTHARRCDNHPAPPTAWRSHASGPPAARLRPAPTRAQVVRPTASCCLDQQEATPRTTHVTIARQLPTHGSAGKRSHAHPEAPARAQTHLSKAFACSSTSGDASASERSIRKAGGNTSSITARDRKFANSRSTSGQSFRRSALSTNNFRNAVSAAHGCVIQCAAPHVMSGGTVRGGTGACPTQGRQARTG